MTDEIIKYLKDTCQAYTAEESFRDSMDECCPMEGIFASFHPADILKEMDPIAYNCGVSEESDSLRDRDCVEIEEDVFVDYLDAIGEIENLHTDGDITDDDIEEAIAEIEELYNDK